MSILPIQLLPEVWDEEQLAPGAYDTGQRKRADYYDVYADRHYRNLLVRLLIQVLPSGRIDPSQFSHLDIRTRSDGAVVVRQWIGDPEAINYQERKPSVYAAMIDGRRVWWAEANMEPGDMLSRYRRGPFGNWRLALKWALNPRFPQCSG